jgi:UDP-N-acetylmuramoylalanine--D-glutamate ligase
VSEAGGPGALADARRDFPWQTLRVVVAGIGVSGAAAAQVLRRLGADVVAVDGRDDAANRERAEPLRARGVDVRLGDRAEAAEAPEALAALLEGCDLVVTSPGWRPDAPLLVAAARLGLPVWGEVELAWRLRPLEDPAPWLCLTGTNGKTTTVRMLTAMLEAAGASAVAAGNVGLPLLDAVLAEPAHDVIAVELSSFQLHWTHSVRPLAAAVLNIAPDHVDWHGGLDAYAADKGRIYAGAQVACVYNAADPRTEQLVREADVEEGCTAVGFTLGAPAVGQLGVVDDLLVDRAFHPDRHRSAAELGSVRDVSPLAPHNVENALAAAALARAYGVPESAVRDGLRRFAPDAHRIATVAEVDGVTWVDDSKATNPHAAAASLRAFERVVWVAGGLAKGATFDELVAAAAPRLAGVVLLGRDRDLIRAALARHAPDVPVFDVGGGDTEAVAGGAPGEDLGERAMEVAVREAARLAEPGHTVLLAPACASMDLFTDYRARGQAFAAAVRRLHADSGEISNGGGA